MTNKSSAMIVAAVACVLIVLAITVWPTRYRYDHINVRGTVLPVRTDRFSGRTEILGGMNGWVEVGDRQNVGTANPETHELPPVENAKVTGNAGLGSGGTLFQGKLYNGSSFNLREVVITITALEKSGELRWSRQFKDDVFIEPLTTGSFQIAVTGANDAKLSWTIDTLRGEPRKPFGLREAALDVPPLRGRINDYAGLIPADRAQALEERLARFEAETGHQIAVLTIPSLKGDSLEDFSIRVAESWKIGKKGFDNGVILLIARDDRRLRIEVGYGLEGVMPSALASQIIREVITPPFRSGDYVGGIEDGVDAIMKVARGRS